MSWFHHLSTLARCSCVALTVLGLTGCGVEDAPPITRSAQALRTSHLGDPLPGLSAELLDLFFEGEAQFEREFTLQEGLGPLFIERSCVACHRLGGIGGADRLTNENHFVVRLPPAEVIQTRSIAGMGTACDILPEALAPGTPVARRNPLQVFGDGFIDHISTATLGEFVRPVPVRGVRGKLGTGRFGWKAQGGTLTGFTVAAANGTMSLTTGASAEQTRFGLAPELVDPDCSNAALGVASPNDDGQFLRPTVAWEALLAQPERRWSAEAARGERVFTDTGCALCHRPSMATKDEDYILLLADGSTRNVPQLRNQTAELYSDLLLHDMGPAAAELITQGNAAASEFRTQPLWGVGHRKRFLHDGSAGSLDEAVRRHGGEAEEIRTAYLALSHKRRQELLNFLRSL